MSVQVNLQLPPLLPMSVQAKLQLVSVVGFCKQDTDLQSFPNLNYMLHSASVAQLGSALGET